MTDSISASWLHDLIGTAARMGMDGCHTVEPRHLCLSASDIRDAKLAHPSMATVFDDVAIRWSQPVDAEEIRLSREYDWNMVVAAPIMIVTAHEWRQNRRSAEVWVLRPGITPPPLGWCPPSRYTVGRWMLLEAITHRVARVWDAAPTGDCRPIRPGPWVDAVQGCVSALQNAVRRGCREIETRRMEEARAEHKRSEDRLAAAEDILNGYAMPVHDPRGVPSYRIIGGGS